MKLLFFVFLSIVCSLTYVGIITYMFSKGKNDDGNE